MAILQVRNIPDELYAAVKVRAAEEGITVSDLVVRNLRREVAYPSLQQWLDEVTAMNAPYADVDVDITTVMGEVRDEVDGKL